MTDTAGRNTLLPPVSTTCCLNRATHGAHANVATYTEQDLIKPKPFKAGVSEEKLEHFKQLLKLSKTGPKAYENQVTDVKDYKFGISRQWLSDAKQHWETRCDWRVTEAKINSFPNLTVPIEEDGFRFNVHFVARFSQKPDAVPLLLSHVWPGSFLECLG